MYALHIAELQASWLGRAGIDPGPHALRKGSTWLSKGPLRAFAFHDAEEAGIDLHERNDTAVRFMEKRRVHYHRTLRWVAYGMPVYRVDRDTVHALAATGVGGIRFDDLQMPFPTMLIYFDGPARYLHLSIRGEITAARVMWIHASEDGPGERRCIHVHLFTRTDRDGAMAVIPDGETSLDRFMADYPTDNGREMLAFAVSFLLYLASVPPKQCRTRVPGVDRAKRNEWELPSEWQVVRAKIEGRESDAHGAARPHANPRAHVVRGHWRMQACGHGRAQRKPTWIKPHWRGEFCPGITRDMEKR